MDYTIKEVSEMTNLSISTLRYYDKEGLLPELERKESGYRIFTDGHLDLLKVIDSFKKAGLQIKDIQHYISLAYQGEATLRQRYEIFLNQEKLLDEKIADLQEALKVTRIKKSFYEKAIEASTEDALLCELRLHPFRKLE